MDNILIAEIRKVIQCSKQKKIIIWGTANIAAYVFSTIKALGEDIAYFIDSSEKRQGESYYGKEIKSPYDVMYEDIEHVVVILAFTNSYEVEGTVKEIGLTIDQNCFDLKKIEQPKRCDLFDPLLGYSRMDDIEGYKILNPGKRKKILILGGSTTDWSVSHINAWPVYLNHCLMREGYEYSVYNGAVVGYYSSQELLKCIRDILSIRPDMVLSYSGVNDADWGKTDKSRPYICSYLYDNCEKIIKKDAIARAGINKVETIGYGQEWKGSDTDLWISNMRMLHAICEEFGIKFFSFLQPTEFYGDYMLSEIEKIILHEQYGEEQIIRIKDFFKRLSQETDKYSYLYDFTRIFDGEEGIFYDAMHTDERGNQMIADKVYETIKRELD